MPRHADFVPHGVIPAVLLPFNEDLSIDERSFRSHLRDVAATKGISAITINAHSTEVGSCSFDEQRRVLEIAQDEVGARLPLVNGVWADGSIEAARSARMAAEGGASALLVFPPAPFTLGQSPEMALAHFKRIAEATDLPIIAFQYPLATGQGYPRDTLLRLVEQVPALPVLDLDHPEVGVEAALPPDRRVDLRLLSLGDRRPDPRAARVPAPRERPGRAVEGVELHDHRPRRRIPARGHERRDVGEPEPRQVRLHPELRGQPRRHRSARGGPR